jgi:hypothetical protein
MIDRAVSRIMEGISLPQVEETPLLGPVKELLYLRKWGDDYPYLPGESCALSSCLPVPADSPAQIVIRRMNRLV